MVHHHALNILLRAVLLGAPESESVRETQTGASVDTLIAARKCSPSSGTQARDCTPAPIPGCLVAIDREDRRVRVTDASRRKCLSGAQLIEPKLPLVSDDELRTGPPSESPLGSDQDVHCRLAPRPEQGGSLKFRCMRTNPQNQLYDEGGDLIPAAASVDADGGLLDARGKEIPDDDGKPREGDELRVKYFVGAEPAARYREMFTETVVSRLFWVLGIPVDQVYMPASVRCFGCSATPFGQLIPVTSSTAQVFSLASVERPYAGKKISVPRSRGPFGLGGKYDHGFGFDEIGELLPGLPRARRIDAEVMAIALNIVGYNNTHSYQNELVCRRGQWDKRSGECSSVVAYVSDVGGSLGGANAFRIKGEDRPEMLRFPRGDFVTLSQGAVFADRNFCTLRYPIGAIREVSEPAREAMDARIRGRIGREQLRIIFEAASIHRMESRVNDLVAEQYKLPPGPALDRAVQLLWADEVGKRFDEILTGRCPS